MQPEQHGTSTTPAVPPGPLPGWQQVVDAMPQLVWIADGEGTVWFYNQRVHDYSGPVRGDDGTWAWRPLIHADDTEATSQAWGRAVASASPYVCEHRIRMADGTYRWHVSRAIPVRSGADVTWVGTATDIHDRALAEQRARRSEQRLARVIDGLFSFVGLLSVDGTLLEANESALQAGGVRREDVVGLPLWDTYWWSHDPAVQRRLREAIELAARGEPSRYDVEARVAGGGSIIIDFQLVPLVEDGEVTALIPSATDITDRIVERDRLEALAALSHELNGAIGTDEVCELICELAPATIDADFVTVGLVDDHRLSLDLVVPDGVDDDVSDGLSSVRLEGRPTPFRDVMATGEAIYLDAAEREARYPQIADVTDSLGLTVTANLPLRSATGEVFGALGCGWRAEVELDGPLRSRLRLLAALCSQALERSKRAGVQDRLVRELQDRLLHGHERATDLDVAVGYRPAQEAIGFGGDWYDVIQVDDDVTAFVVGDVAGHGIAASAEMATTKATVRATILSAASRAEVLPVASRALGHLGSGFVATVAAAWIDTAAGTVEWRLAGHPPPVLRTPAGTRLLEGAHHPPLGMPTQPREGGAEAFPPGSLLVLYTDGLVERPGVDLDHSFSVLRAAVEALPAGLDATAARDRLMAELAADRPVDDVAIAVVVRPG